MNAYPTVRGILIFIAGFGCLTGAQLSLDQLQQGEVCPLLGPVPACYIVFLGYFGILVAAVMVRKDWSKKLFYSGWTLVFLLALFGVVLELINGHICPPGLAHVPQCFYSLAMSVLCLLLFRNIYKTAR